MLALVTGSGGFVGPYLTEELLKQGHRVRALVRRRADHSINPRLLSLQKKWGPDSLEIIRGDVTNFQDMLLVGGHVDWIFHLAAQTFEPDGFLNPSYTFETNARGTQNVLDMARLHRNHAKLVLVSSSTVYGKQDKFPINEENPTRPQSPYASAKLFSESLAYTYWKHYGLKTVISRSFSHEGAFRGHTFITASVIRQLVMIKNGEARDLHVGDISVTRDWSHVKDVVRAYILLAEKGEPGEIYVVGSGTEHTVDYFIHKAAEIIGVVFSIKQDRSRLRGVDVPRLQADPSKIRKLGWAPEFDLSEIIEDTAQWYSEMTPEERMAIQS